jgi:50S ribosomal protein L16 3-hydroxylase
MSIQKKRRSSDTPLPHLGTHLGAHLGNLTARKFLDEYWQQKPLLIRGAFAKSFAPLTCKEILTLAGYEDAESRLVTKRGREWSMARGPFSTKDFKQLHAETRTSATQWTVLVQDTQHFSYEAHALLAKFNFIPQSRIDDLMVSYAVKGGGVGPHVDSYDVFLIQGNGKRRWQISSQKDLSIHADLPLKILKHFKHTSEWVLEAGDMLYLPPHWAHHGIAETDECVTWSVGFRAPTWQEMLESYLDVLQDQLTIDVTKKGERFTDAKREPAIQSGLIDKAMQSTMTKALAKGLRPALTSETLHQFLGCYLTQPKSHVEFMPPEDSSSPAAFARIARAEGICLDLRSRLLFDATHFFLNGEKLNINKNDMRAWQTLSNARQIGAEIVHTLHAETIVMLHDLHQRGYLQTGNPYEHIS